MSSLPIMIIIISNNSITKNRRANKSCFKNTFNDLASEIIKDNKLLLILDYIFHSFDS